MAGDPGRLGRQLPGPVGQAVLGQHPWQGAEAVGLHHVATHVQEAAVQIGNHVGPGVDQDLVAAFQGRAPEVVRPQMAQLQIGPGGPVEDHDPGGERVQVGVRGGHPSKVTGRSGGPTRHSGRKGAVMPPGTLLCQ